MTRENSPKRLTETETRIDKSVSDTVDADCFKMT